MLGAANSSEALDVQLKHPSDSSKDVQFNPTFTYSIFGDEEVIYGYKDLRVILLFKGDTLDPGLDVRFGDKIDRVGDVKLDSVEEKLKDFLPSKTEAVHLILYSTFANSRTSLTRRSTPSTRSGNYQRAFSAAWEADSQI